MAKTQIVMDWAADFECPGGDCGLTCCSAKWAIRLLDSELELYKSLDGELGELIREGVDFDNKLMRNNGEVCCLLNEEGYCRVVLAGGADCLSATCTVFPRRLVPNRECKEILVEIVCPLVAERLLDSKQIEYYQITSEDDDYTRFSNEEREK